VLASDVDDVSKTEPATWGASTSPGTRTLSKGWFDALEPSLRAAGRAQVHL